MDNQLPVRSYNPYTKDSWKKIKEGWNLYKSTFGLEGDLYLELKKQNLSEGEIARRLDEHRKSRESLTESYRKEVGRNG